MLFRWLRAAHVGVNEANSTKAVQDSDFLVTSLRDRRPCAARAPRRMAHRMEQLSVASGQ
jgi:hypothetical protein